MDTDVQISLDQSLAPAENEFVLQDSALRYPRLHKALVDLGGQPRVNQALVYHDPSTFERAQLVLDTWLDQTVIIDPNAYFVRDILTSPDPFYAQKFGGSWRRLADDSYAYEFPSPQQAANALAVIHEARQLQPSHIEGLEIIRNALTEERMEQQLSHMVGAENPSRPELDAFLRDGIDISDIDRWTATRIVRDARPLLYELNISPSHARNVERLEIIRESLDRERATQLFGFDTITDPLRWDELTADHLATANMVLTAMPQLRDLGINLNQIAAERQRLLNPTSTVRAPRTAAVAPTAFEHETLFRDIGGYAQDEKERLQAQRDELGYGPERLKVMQTLKEAIESQGQQLGEQIELQPGELAHVRILSYNANVVATGTSDDIPDLLLKLTQHNRYAYNEKTQTLRDLRGEFVGIQITARYRPNLDSFKAAPYGTEVKTGVNTVRLTRPGSSVIEYAIRETEQGNPAGGYQLIATANGKTQIGGEFAQYADAKVALAEIDRKARISAGLDDQHVSSVGYAIVPVTDFANADFGHKYFLRQQFADAGVPLTLMVQRDRGFVYTPGHLTRPAVHILKMDDHVVSRPLDMSMAQDYKAVLAAAKVQVAGYIRSVAAAKLLKEPANVWAQGAQNQQPSAVKERLVTNVATNTATVGEAGIECEVLNIGQWYVATRNAFSVAIHEKAAFPMGREFTVGERFGVVYEDGIPREYDPVNERPRTFEHVPEHKLEHVAARDLDGGSALVAKEERAQARLEAATLLGLLEKTQRELAIYSEQPEIARERNAMGLVRPPAPGERISGHVLGIEYEGDGIRRNEGRPSIGAIGRIVDGQPCFTVIKFSDLQESRNIGLRDQVTIDVDDANRMKLNEHRGRAQLLDDFKIRSQKAVAKQEHGETVIHRDVNLKDDRLVGEVVLLDNKIGALAIKTGPRSVATYDATKIERPLQVGDRVTIVSYDYTITVTDHTPKQQLTLPAETSAGRSTDAGAALMR